MVQLAKDQRVWVCEEMARIDNAHEVRWSWPNRWPGVQASTVRTILKTFRKRNDYDTSLNRNQRNSGRPRTARSAANIQNVRRSLQGNGVTSARRRGLGLSRSSFSRIVHQKLRYHPHVLVRHQALRPQDPALRLAFCQWFLQMSNENPAFLNNLITSDEATFSLKFRG